MSSIFGNPHHAKCRSRWAADALDQIMTQKHKPRHSLSVVGVGTMAHGTAGVRSVGRRILYNRCVLVVDGF
jgi:hypothetical protein